MRLTLAVRAPGLRAGVEPVRRRSSWRIGRAFRGIPRAAWICALIAFLNATAWSLIVPPFEGKDEADHFAYVEDIVENGVLPENGQPNGVYSAQETHVLEALRYPEVVHSPQSTDLESKAQQRALVEANDANQSLIGSGEAGIATSEPPLYYAVEAVPYLMARGNILLQLQLMRLVGALFGALTALFTFLFLREILPRARWAATVGALCVALQPLLAFMSGSVNPDSMLVPVSAALFLCLARAFRRTLTRRLAVVLGIVIAVGFLTKLNFVGLAVGAFIGLVVLAVRGVKASGRTALLAPSITVLIGISPVALYVLRNALASHATLGIASRNPGLFEPSSLLRALTYTWQLFLPRIPGMTHYFEGIVTYKDIWFDRSVGLYGWMDTMFPGWVSNVALVPAAAVALLFGRGLLMWRRELRARLPEFAVYVVATLSLLLLIGVWSYQSDVLEHQPAFGEPRYLLPLLPLFAGVATVAVRGAGRRWAPMAGAALVVLVFGYDIVSQLQVIARYYG